MRFAGITEVLDHLRSARAQLDTRRLFAVKHPERIVFESDLAILAQIVEFLFVVVRKFLFVRWPAFFDANAVDVHQNIFETKLGQDKVKNLDHQGINNCIRLAQHLDPKLAELAKAATLRIFMPEKGTA